MNNSEQREVENQSDSLSFLEETIQGISEEELHTRVGNIDPELQNIQQAGPEVSLRPSVQKRDQSVDASSIGQRQIQAADAEQPCG